MSFHKFPPRLALGLGLAVALDTGTQLLWKAAVIELPDSDNFPSLILTTLQQPLFVVVLLLMIGQFLNWQRVLVQSDLSFAHAITSLSYVTVPLCSVLWLEERIDFVQIFGILLILVGVRQISKTSHVSIVDTLSDLEQPK